MDKSCVYGDDDDLMISGFLLAELLLLWKPTQEWGLDLFGMPRIFSYSRIKDSGGGLCEGSPQ